VVQARSVIVTCQTGDMHLEHLVEGMQVLTLWVGLLMAPIMEQMPTAMLMDKVGIQLGQGPQDMVLATTLPEMGLAPSLAMAMQQPLLPKVRQQFGKVVSNLCEKKGEMGEWETSG
jgi:hypothetical protein